MRTSFKLRGRLISAVIITISHLLELGRCGNGPAELLPISRRLISSMVLGLAGPITNLPQMSRNRRNDLTLVAGYHR